MARRRALAGVTLTTILLALSCACALGGAHARSARPALKPAGGVAVAAARQAGPGGMFERAGVTPLASPGTRAASRRGLSTAQLRNKLRAGMRRAGGSSGAWVYDFKRKKHKVLFDDHASKNRILASNSKLFTTTAYMARFGPKHHFATRVWLRGKRTNGGHTLHGAVYLRGDGDPALASRHFASANGLPLTKLSKLALAIRRAGIKRVKNGIVVDRRVFDARRGIPQPGVSGGPFLGPLSGLSYNSGFTQSGSSYSSDPSKTAGEALAQQLKQRGVVVRGRVRHGAVPAKMLRHKALASSGSPSVRDLIAATNKPSNNFFAEMLLKRLAATKKQRGTTARGARRAEKFARSLGASVRMVNGSGLARANRASPRDVGRILIAIRKKPGINAMTSTLSIAGRDGTLAGRMRGTAAEGRCRGKTGTIDGVSALSGYCNTHGRIKAFSFLMNGVDIGRAMSAQDSMVAAIARYKP